MYIWCNVPKSISHHVPYHIPHIHEPNLQNSNLTTDMAEPGKQPKWFILRRSSCPFDHRRQSCGAWPLRSPPAPASPGKASCEAVTSTAWTDLGGDGTCGSPGPCTATGGRSFAKLSMRASNSAEVSGSWVSWTCWLKMGWSMSQVGLTASSDFSGFQSWRGPATLTLMFEHHG